jgi:hypothetical protein
LAFSWKDASFKSQGRARELDRSLPLAGSDPVFLFPVEDKGVWLALTRWVHGNRQSLQVG